MEISLTNDLAECDTCKSETYWRAKLNESETMHPVCGTCLGL